MKKVLKVIGIVLLVLVIAAGGFVGYLTIAEYKPADREKASIPSASVEPKAFPGDTVRVLSFNTGYGGLGDNVDFFMDGGKNVKSSDEERVRANVAEIIAFLQETNADFTLLQEVDQDSSRTYGFDEISEYFLETGWTASYAINYNCAFVPFPIPPIGRVLSGIETLTPYDTRRRERISLPCPFSWPVSVANLKRCLLVTRTPIEGSDKELVIVNLHLEAYDDGEGKIEQTRMLLSVLEEEYEKGNYVIAGGDFNQTFPGSLEAYPVRDGEMWTPGVLESDQLPEGWQYAYDVKTPSCRLLNEPYDPESENTQFYVIDGFIVSPNVQVVSVETQDLQFHASDHNPVLLEAKLLQ